MADGYHLLEEASRNRTAFSFLGGDLTWIESLRLHLMLDSLEDCANQCEEAFHRALKPKENENSNPLYNSDLLELELVARRLTGVVRYLRGRFFVQRGDFQQAIGEFCRSLEAFERMATLLENDERYSIALTRKWLETIGANVELYDQDSAVHRAFITCHENAISAAAFVKGQIEHAQRREPPADISVLNSVMHWSTRDLL